jgi:predicted transcriptional regulator of viral defense system
MTRSISTSMAGVLEKLELERPTIVTSETLAEILQNEGIQTPTRIVAARLREKGWLLPTPKSGVWEFVPASAAGAYSSNDPLIVVKSLIIKHEAIGFGLTFQTAAWLHGVADRVPSRCECAAVNAHSHRLLRQLLSSSVFSPRLAYCELKGVPVLAPESVLVHMAVKPGAVRSWQSALDWLPDLAGLLKSELLQQEIECCSDAAKARTGYLLKGMRPDIAEMVYELYPPKYKTWFGSRAPLLRHDNRWLIADTILPFDPGKMVAMT